MVLRRDGVNLRFNFLLAKVSEIADVISLLLIFFNITVPVIRCSAFFQLISHLRLIFTPLKEVSLYATAPRIPIKSELNKAVAL